MSTQLIQTSSLRPGQFILVNGKPCKILNITGAKPGKHGAAKTIFEAKDIITGKNVETSAASKGTIEVPDTTRETWTVIDINNENENENYLALMKII